LCIKGRFLLITCYRPHVSHLNNLLGCVLGIFKHCLFKNLPCCCLWAFDTSVHVKLLLALSHVNLHFLLHCSPTTVTCYAVQWLWHVLLTKLKIVGCLVALVMVVVVVSLVVLEFGSSCFTVVLAVIRMVRTIPKKLPYTVGSFQYQYLLPILIPVKNCICIDFHICSTSVVVVWLLNYHLLASAAVLLSWCLGIEYDRQKYLPVLSNIGQYPVPILF